MLPIWLLLSGIWLIPSLLLIASHRVRGVRRLAWLAVLLLTSWLGWIWYATVAPGYQRLASNKQRDTSGD